MTFEAKPQQVEAGRCTGCAECEKACPTGAIAVESGTAVIKQPNCINCMCCHEVCRPGAIVPRRSAARHAAELAAGAARRLRRTRRTTS